MIVTTEYLKTTPEKYEEIRLQLWMRWCEGKSMTSREWQRLLASSAINDWFNNQVEIRERQFMRDVQPYRAMMTTKELIAKYNQYMVELHRLFLRPQQNKIRKVSITKEIMSYERNHIYLN